MKAQKQPEYVYKPKNTKFEGVSSYKQEFQPKKNTSSDLVLSSQEVMNAPATYQRNKPKIPFEGQSSYKNTFVKHEVKPEKQQPYEYKPKNTKFQG